MAKSEIVPTNWAAIRPSQIKRFSRRNPGGGELLTKQDQADLCDANLLVPRYLQTGQWPSANRTPMYLDMRDIPDLANTLQAAATAKEAFASLPATVRDAAANDPVKFLQMLETEAGCRILQSAGLDITITQNQGNSPPRRGTPQGRHLDRCHPAQLTSSDNCAGGSRPGGETNETRREPELQGSQMEARRLRKRPQQHPPPHEGRVPILREIPPEAPSPHRDGGGGGNGAAMPCYQPLPALREDGKIRVLSRKLPPEHKGNYLELPCGQCIDCRITRSKEWAIRCEKEAQAHTQNCFLTLTFRDEYLANAERNGKIPYSLNRRDWQLFMKRLRKHISPKPLRYFHVGEYGEQTLRPHYHALLFGHDFSEDRVLSGMSNGNPFYRSSKLEKIWPHGHSTIGQLTPETIAYVCRYVTKKYTGKTLETPGPNGLTPYQRANPETGEIWEVEPEHATMSRNPAIGMNWIEQHHTHTFPADNLMFNRTKQKPPAKYLDWLKKNNKTTYDQVKEQRIQHLINNPQNRTKERRTTLKQLTALKLKARKKRTL